MGDVVVYLETHVGSQYLVLHTLEAMATIFRPKTVGARSI